MPATTTAVGEVRMRKPSAASPPGSLASESANLPANPASDDFGPTATTGVSPAGQAFSTFQRISVRRSTSSTSIATAFFSWTLRSSGATTTALERSRAPRGPMQTRAARPNASVARQITGVAFHLGGKSKRRAARGHPSGTIIVASPNAASKRHHRFAAPPRCPAARSTLPQVPGAGLEVFLAAAVDGRGLVGLPLLQVVEVRPAGAAAGRLQVEFHEPGQSSASTPNRKLPNCSRVGQLK